MCAACFHQQQDLLQCSSRLQAEPLLGPQQAESRGRTLALSDGAQSCIPCIEELMEELGVWGILPSGFVQVES